MSWAGRVEQKRASATRGMAAAIAILAFAVRFAWGMLVQSPFDALFTDMAQYHARALDFLDGVTNGDPRTYAFFPWGAHVLVGLELAAVGRTSHVGVALVHAVVSTVPAVCVVFFTARSVRSRLIVAAAGLLAAFWQPAIVHVGFFMSEMWFSAALVLGTLLLLRSLEGKSGALGAGAAFAVAIVVRPQALVTLAIVGALLGVVALVRGRGTWKGWLRFATPIALMLALSAARFHSLTGHYGLVSENGPLNRIFGATHVGRVEARWRNEYGEFGAWYTPPAKMPVKPDDVVQFDGYIGDAEVLGRIREEHARRETRRQSAVRMWRNTRMLLFRVVFPEDDAAVKSPVRLRLQKAYRFIVVNLTPIGFFGLVAMLFAKKRRLTALLIFANGLTVIIVAALYFAEARMRMPYDPFLITSAAAGLATVFAIGRRVRDLVRQKLGHA